MIPQKTIAAVLFESGKPLKLMELKIPDLTKGQVLVKVVYSGLCHSQLMEVRGKRGPDKYLPHLLGHEGSGIVVDVGRGVKKVKKGDNVVLTWIKGKGIDCAGTIYWKGNLAINAGPITTFSEYTVVSENRCVRISEEIPMEVASLLGCAVLTGAGIIKNTVQLKPFNSIAIFGIGGVGLSMLMAVNLYKCSTIIAVDTENEKLRISKEFGATHIINSSCENPIERIFNITGGIGVDFGFEAAGTVATIEQAFTSVRKNGGICVFASHPAFGDKINIDPFDLICGKHIRGSWGGETLPDRDIPYFIELYKKGNFPIDKMISKIYSLEEINQALVDLENRLVVRALLKIS